MPRRPDFSEDVRRLVRQHVDSIGALDLLTVIRDDAERWWTVTDVCDVLRCPSRWATIHLERMHQGGLLAANAGDERRYAFRPRDARLGGAVEELAEAYRARPGDVVKLIFSLPGAQP